jgi:putative Mg2+ transporter-C (MgtC) family protein
MGITAVQAFLEWLPQGLGPGLLSLGELCARLGVAALCGCLLGLDRELRHKTLGWRTYMLVSLGAASFSVLMNEMVHAFQGDNLRLDPTRIVEGVIGGIGFMGAGAMIQDRGRLRGGTTGAGIWMVGAIGMAAGFGFYLHAAVMTAFALLVITVFGALANWLQRDGGGGGPEQAHRPSAGDRG